jgi:hypothetical protein
LPFFLDNSGSIRKECRGCLRWGEQFAPGLQIEPQGLASEQDLGRWHALVLEGFSGLTGQGGIVRSRLSRAMP